MNNPQRHRNGASLTPMHILRVLGDPALRMSDHPGLVRAGVGLIRNPNDRHLAELLQWGVERQVARAAENLDPFYSAYPPLTAPLDFDIPVCGLPDGRAFGLLEESLCRGTALIGPTGRGKSSMLRVIAWQAATRSCVLIVDRKREMRNLHGFPNIGARWLLFNLQQLKKKIAFLQPPPGVPSQIWANDLVDLVARSYSLYASRRLLLDLLLRCYQQDGDTTTLRKWEKRLRAFEPGKGLREAGYKEAAMFVMTSMRSTLGTLDCAQSNLLELLFDERGGIIIEVDTLPVEHYSFFVSYLHRWIYQWRVYAR